MAALLAFGSTTHLSPELQVLATVLGGALAAVSHSSKLAVRTAVTPSPEPLSNIALSGVEDVAAIGLTWTATHYPYAAAGAVILVLVGVLLAARWAIRAIRRAWQRWNHREDETHLATR